MTRSFTNLLFQTAKQLAKLQRLAIRNATRKPARLRTSKKPAGVTAPDKTKSGAHRKNVKSTALGKGKFEARRQFISSDLRRLAFARYTPAAQSGKGLALLVMLHGCRQTAMDFALGTRMNQRADDHEFMIIYPEQAVTRQAYRCWRWFEPDAAHGLADADAIAALTRSEIARHGLDSARVYIAGLSAGASMAAITALRHPDLYHAVALHSGAVLGDAHSARAGLRTMRRGAANNAAPIGKLINPLAFKTGMPAIIIHGTQDKAVSARNAEQLRDQFLDVNRMDQSSGMPARLISAATSREYVLIDYRRAGKTRLRYVQIRHLEHAWSGGDGSIAYHSNKGPDASKLIWQFLKHQTGRTTKTSA
jgi:poly(hydroxyalkanoate) depolymerase family esterase